MLAIWCSAPDGIGRIPKVGVGACLDFHREGAENAKKGRPDQGKGIGAIVAKWLRLAWVGQKRTGPPLYNGPVNHKSLVSAQVVAVARFAVGDLWTGVVRKSPGWSRSPRREKSRPWIEPKRICCGAADGVRAGKQQGDCWRKCGHMMKPRWKRKKS